jgi:peptidoglycan/LPS O-acetylase OafA/YrhL
MDHPQKLAALAAGRDNNLNAIRLGLALLVILSHSFPLATGREADPLSTFSHGLASFGSLAVDLFFFISGMLITASWLNSKSMNDYLRRRVLRIYPGYFCGIAFGFLAATVFAAEPFGDLTAKLRTFRDVIFLGTDSMAGEWMFPANHFPDAANGSLWTIFWEFICYVSVAVIGLWGFFKYRRWILAVFACVVGYYIFKHLPDDKSMWRIFTCFLSGTCVWLWRDKIPVRGYLALIAGAIFVAATQLGPYGAVLMKASAFYVTIWVGYAARLPLVAWCRKADFSYGTYLYAFPVQQMLAAVGIQTPWTMFALAVPIVLAIAAASWFLVEKPCLDLKSQTFGDRDPAVPVRG